MNIKNLVAAGIKQEVAEIWLPHVEQALARYDINTDKQVAAWIAQSTDVFKFLDIAR